MNDMALRHRRNICPSEKEIVLPEYFIWQYLRGSGIIFYLKDATRIFIYVKQGESKILFYLGALKFLAFFKTNYGTLTHISDT